MLSNNLYSEYTFEHGRIRYVKKSKPHKSVNLGNNAIFILPIFQMISIESAWANLIREGNKIAIH
jgi:hypothetical protein